MSTGTVLLVMLISFVVAFLYVQGRMSAVGTAEGTALPEEAVGALPEGATADGALLYFFSPTCGPCRAMTPHVKALAEERDDVFLIDVSADVDLAMALGVRATPTVLVLKDGKLAASRVGALTPSALHTLAP